MAVASALSGATPASAQVLAIGEDGTIATYTGAAVWTDSGVTPIPAYARAPNPGAAPAAIRRELAAAAAVQALDPALLEAVAWAESRFRHDALSPKGAVGVMQLMPETARMLGVDRFDMTQNIAGGAAYLGGMMRRFGGNRSLALAAYNAGPGAVLRYGGVPPFAETQAYVAQILARVGAGSGGRE